MHTEINLNNCIEEIATQFLFDSLILLDCVLEDDLDDPEYSANTVCSRLEKYLVFQNLYYKYPMTELSEFLIEKGYSKQDIEYLRNRQEEEKRKYSWIPQE